MPRTGIEQITLFDFAVADKIVASGNKVSAVVTGIGNSRHVALEMDVTGDAAARFKITIKIATSGTVRTPETGDIVIENKAPGNYYCAVPMPLCAKLEATMTETSGVGEITAATVKLIHQ